MTLAKQTIECALRAVGVREGDTPATKGKPNRGKWVDVYTRFLGMLGVPWCACFVAYKIHQAAKELGVKTQWPKAAWGGSCTRIYLWAKKNGHLLDAPTENCVFLVPNNGKPGFRHIGFVVKKDPSDPVVDTVEGNTNDEGSAEGYEVAKRRRRAASLTYIRIV